MGNKIDFSKKMFDLRCMNFLKDSVRYPYNMEHTLLNSVIWGTSLCIPIIHDAMLILNDRDKYYRLWFYGNLFNTRVFGHKAWSERDRVLSDAREYIYNRKNGTPTNYYKFDIERFVYMLISTNRLYRRR
jgi:hypothetical protein